MEHTYKDMLETFSSGQSSRVVIGYVYRPPFNYFIAVVAEHFPIRLLLRHPWSTVYYRYVRENIDYCGGDSYCSFGLHTSDRLASRGRCDWCACGFSFVLYCVSRSADFFILSGAKNNDKTAVQ